MGHSRRSRLAVVAIGAIAALVLATAASAGKAFKETFVEEETILLEDFCDVPGLDVELVSTAEVTVHAVPHGSDGLIHFHSQTRRTDVFTANGASVTGELRVIERDLHVTDNGDGTLTIVNFGTGNIVLYDEAGNVIARDPGQTRVEFLVDHAGTPTDPEDDVFLEFLGVLKESTGRTDDFCTAVVPALT